MLWTFEQVLLLVCAVADLIVVVGAGVNYYLSSLTPTEGANGRRAERSRKAKVTLVVVIIVCALIGGLLGFSQTAAARPIVQRALCPSPALSTDYPLYTGTGLTPGFDFGIDSSAHQYNWFTDALKNRF